MNVPEYLKLARKVLNEDAGSEGLVYLVEAKSGLKTIETDLIRIDEVENIDGSQRARVNFVYPHDYGFALNTIKEALEGVEITALSLVY